MRTKRLLATLLVLIMATATVGATYLLTTNNRRSSSTSSSIATISVSPKDIMTQVEIGQTFTVNITITNASDLYVWQAGMIFNATILEALNFAEGQFLTEYGNTLWVNATINNTAGIIHYHASALAGDVSGVSGNGTLGIITFKVRTYSNSTLQLTEVILLNSTLSDMDKTLVHGTILATIPGDVNGDRRVDIFDIGTISSHWYPGPPEGPLGFDGNADINDDEAVDILDIDITSAHWGQTW